MNTFYRVLLRGIRTARRASGNHRVSLRLRRAALQIERLLPGPDPSAGVASGFATDDQEQAA